MRPRRTAPSTRTQLLEPSDALAGPIKENN